MDAFHATLASKQKEIEQLNTDFQSLAEQVRDAKSQSQTQTKATKTTKTAKTTAGKKTAKKTASKKKAASQESAEDADDEAVDATTSTDSSASSFSALLDYASLGIQQALNHRAVIMFAAASAGVFLYGDYASV
jgi:chromosome segregation ATPase